MKLELRRREILRQLDIHGSMRVIELSNICNVTEETIRRDLDYLEKKGYLTRTHGGAIKAINQDEIDFNIRNMHNRIEKQAIGKRAAELVKPGDVIALDASTTALHLAYYLKEKKDIVIITHAIKVVMEFLGNPDVTVISTGGILQARTISFVGILAENAFDSYNITKAFISCKGLTLREGITESTEMQARVKSKMVNSAKELILIADHDKFGRAALAKVAPATKINKLITDAGTPLDELEEYKKDGIEVIVAG